MNERGAPTLHRSEVQREARSAMRYLLWPAAPYTAFVMASKCIPQFLLARKLVPLSLQTTVRALRRLTKRVNASTNESTSSELANSPRCKDDTVTFLAAVMVTKREPKQLIPVLEKGRRNRRTRSFGSWAITGCGGRARFLMQT